MPIEGTELNLAIQALPNQWQTQMVIPLGIVNTEVGETIFSAASFSLPLDVTVVLEDRQLNTFTNLLTNNYTVTIPIESDPNGRFYLHVGQEGTSIPDVINNSFSVSIYPNPSSGLFNANITLKQPSNIEFALYDISGREVMSIPTVKYSEGNHTVPLNTFNLLPGAYILKVKGFDPFKNSLLFEKGERVLIKAM